MVQPKAQIWGESLFFVVVKSKQADGSSNIARKFLVLLLRTHCCEGLTYLTDIYAKTPKTLGGLPF